LYCRHAERLKAILDTTKGTIAIGGKVDVDEKFMEPTVITGVDWSDACMKVGVGIFRLAIIQPSYSHRRKGGC
jgi:hypothetical protein